MNAPKRSVTSRNSIARISTPTVKRQIQRSKSKKNSNDANEPAGKSKDAKSRDAHEALPKSKSRKLISEMLGVSKLGSGPKDADKRAGRNGAATPTRQKKLTKRKTTELRRSKSVSKGKEPKKGESKMMKMKYQSKKGLSKKTIQESEESEDDSEVTDTGEELKQKGITFPPRRRAELTEEETEETNSEELTEDVGTADGSKEEEDEQSGEETGEEEGYETEEEEEGDDPTEEEGEDDRTEEEGEDDPTEEGDDEDDRTEEGEEEEDPTEDTEETTEEESAETTTYSSTSKSMDDESEDLSYKKSAKSSRIENGKGTDIAPVVNKSKNLKVVNITTMGNIPKKVGSDDAVVSKGIPSFKDNGKKSFSMRVSMMPSFSMKIGSSMHLNKPSTYRKPTTNRITQQILELHGHRHLERRGTQSSLAKRVKLEKPAAARPFPQFRQERKRPLRKPGFVPSFVRQTNNLYSTFRKEDKHKKMKLLRMHNPDTFQIFQNLVVLDKKGEIGIWDGYQWNSVSVPCEEFVSIYTNRFGHVLTINTDYQCGYIQNDRRFRVLNFGGPQSFYKIVTALKGELWGTNLTGDLLKWKKYEWVQIRKAYGISKLKSLSFDRQNNLWVLDSTGFFYVYDVKDKNWVLKDVGGGNIKDFDFNELDNMVAVTNEGLIKIYKKNRWIVYGMLGQKEIANVHFIRENKSIQKVPVKIIGDTEVGMRP